MSAPQDNAGHCAALLREADRDRYWSILLAPADKRPALFALFAFAAEIARVRDAISAPMPGEIRLQWWRDAVEGVARGDAAASPVAAALSDAIERYRLPRDPLVALIDARVFDLYDDPMPTLGDLEGYLGETQSALVRLASIILADGHDPGAAEAAGHAGLAIGLTRLLALVPAHARAGRMFLPKDMLNRYGVTRDDIVLGRGGPGVVSILRDLRSEARRHADRIHALARTIPAAIRPAFLPAALVRADLAALDAMDGRPMDAPRLPADWRRILRLWRAKVRGF